MPYEILTIILALYAISTPVWIMTAVKFGLKVAEKPEKAVEEPLFHIPERKKEPEMTEHEFRNAQILANIDRYDGTSFGQEKVKPREK